MNREFERRQEGIRELGKERELGKDQDMTSGQNPTRFPSAAVWCPSCLGHGHGHIILTVWIQSLTYQWYMSVFVFGHEGYLASALRSSILYVGSSHRFRSFRSRFALCSKQTTTIYSYLISKSKNKTHLSLYIHNTVLQIWHGKIYGKCFKQINNKTKKLNKKNTWGWRRICVRLVRLSEGKAWWTGTLIPVPRTRKTFILLSISPKKQPTTNKTKMYKRHREYSKNIVMGLTWINYSAWKGVI